MDFNLRVIELSRGRDELELWIPLQFYEVLTIKN